MKNVIKFIRRAPVIRDVALFLFRLKTGVGHILKSLKSVLVWLFRSKEFTNYTYDLTTLNKRYLAAFISVVTDKSFQEITSYIEELENDKDLREHIRSTTLANPEKRFADLNARYGRRLGWYALARALKPKIIVETGVDKGLGSCVLAAALMRNEQDGFSGYYYGTDINPVAGYLLSGRYKKYGEILYGDSINSLTVFEPAIDIFINDSDHSDEYENREYAVIADKLSPNAFLVSDNARVSDMLLNFALETNRHFVFFQEQSANHWFAGEGIGVAYRQKGA